MPSKIEWEADDADFEGKKECSSMLLSLWDKEEKVTLAIDLWTKEMLVKSRPNDIPSANIRTTNFFPGL